MTYQLVYATSAAACCLVPGGASNSSVAAAASALQDSQAQQAMQLMGLVDVQQQVTVPIPTLAGGSHVQPIMVPAAGVQRYQQQTSTLVPVAPGLVVSGEPGIGVLRQSPQPSGLANWPASDAMGGMSSSSYIMHSSR